MSGRPRASLRRVLGITACVFLCAAFTTIPGALGQSFPPIQGDASSDTSSDTQAIKSALNNAGDLSNPGDPLIQGDEAQQSSGDNSTASPLGEDGIFTANITVGGVPTPCKFRVIDAGRKYVETYAKYSGTVFDPKNVTPAIDRNAKGDVSIPTTVKNGNTVYTVTSVGTCSFYGCKNITSTGLARQQSITSFTFFSYAHCTGLRHTTGLEDNTKITAVGYFSFSGCENLESTGLANNKAVTKILSGGFNCCTKLRSTGLETNASITTIEKWAFNSCTTLTETGLAGNKKVTNLEIGVFECCHGLTSTGLADNDTLTSLSSQVFLECWNLHSTGLEKNTTIKDIGMICQDANQGCFERCNSLHSTGLEHNKTVQDIGYRTFANCASLVTTGLDENHTVKSLGRRAFERCAKLGAQDVVNDAGKVISNAGDLRLNGGGGSLTIETNAFLNTKYERIYFGGDLTNVTCSEGALDLSAGHKIPTLYVQNKPPWNEKDSFSFGTTTYAKSDGSYIVMDPKLTGLKASRVDGTSDSALLSFTTNHGFKTNISKTDSTSLGDYQVSLPATETGQMQEVTCIIPTGAGLTPGPEELRASIDKFIYPLDAKAQDYNSLPGTSLSCTLDPVTYTITFESNGASGTMDNQQVSYKPDNTLNKLAYTMANMAFKHWSTTKDDTEQSITLKDEDSLSSLPLLQGNTITLFAQWETGLQVLSTHTNSDPLGGISYELSKTDQEPIQPLEGLSTDPEGQNPIHKQGEGGTCWPLISDAQGTISMYWLSEGTYYLYNVWVPAGYNVASSPMKVEVSHKDGKAFVTVNGNEVSKYADATAQMSIAFVESPSLPTTGNLPAGLLQGVGALAAIIVCIALIRRRRNRKQRVSG